MFWKKNQVEFEVGDTVKFKQGTKHGRIRSLVVDNWYGRVMKMDDKGAVLEFDAITISEFPTEFIQMYDAEDMYPHIGYFPKKYLELAEPRNTQEDVIRAQDDLIERIDRANDVPKYRIEYNKWVRHFQISERFGGLDKIDREKSDFVLDVFCNCMKDYEGKTPAKWGIKSVGKALTTWIPQTVTGEERLFETFGVVILEFFKFLDEKGYRNMNSLIPVAIKAKHKIVEESQKRERWGFMKTYLMEALESGIDIEDEGELNRFMQKKQLQALEELKNMQDELEPKYRTTSRAVNKKQFKNIWQNQKITVQYPDGTIKENIKFKDVENDLYEGICELIKK